MSQSADTVKVGAVISDTRPCLGPPRVTDPTLPQAVTSASLQSVSLAPELPYTKRAGNRACRGDAKNRNHQEYVRPVQDVPFAIILRLNDFERFVYVLSVVERFSDQECAALLGISWKELRETRAIALQHVSDFERAVAVSAIDPSSTKNS